MKNLKNIFLLTLILLTSVLVGQNDTIKFLTQSNTVPNSTSTTYTNSIGSFGLKTIETGSLSKPSGTNFTVTTNAITASTLQVTNGLEIITITSNITTTFSFSTQTNILKFTANGTVWFISNLLTNTSTTGINDINQSLPLTTYSNLNTIFVKNTQNIDDVKLEVFNLAGQLVFEDKVTKDRFDLNVSTGIYIIRLSKDDNFVTKKVFLGE